MAVLGSGGFATVEEYLFIESTTWSPWCDCVALVTVVGGGGSGARGANVNNTYLNVMILIKNIGIIDIFT